MFKHIEEGSEHLEGFQYTNKDGDDEFVAFEYDIIEIRDEGHHSLSAIYVDDIPKLIKALQAAYDYKKGQA